MIERGKVKTPPPWPSRGRRGGSAAPCGHERDHNKVRVRAFFHSFKLPAQVGVRAASRTTPCLSSLVELSSDWIPPVRLDRSTFQSPSRSRMASRFHGSPDRAVQALNRICRVGRLLKRRREAKVGDHPCPISLPTLHQVWVASPEFAHGENFQTPILFLYPIVALRLALARVCRDFRLADRQLADVRDPNLVHQPNHFREQPPEFPQEPAVKLANRPVVPKIPRSQRPKRHVPLQLPSQSARRKHSCRITAISTFTIITGWYGELHLPSPSSCTCKADRSRPSIRSLTCSARCPSGNHSRKFQHQQGLIGMAGAKCRWHRNVLIAQCAYCLIRISTAQASGRLSRGRRGHSSLRFVQLKAWQVHRAGNGAVGNAVGQRSMVLDGG